MGFDFVSLPKPSCVTLFGAAENTQGRLANVAELEANNRHYRVLIELPQVRFYEITWDANDNNEFTYEGQISPAALFADKPIIGNKKSRAQLCPTEPWAISFKFPGPVDWRTAWQVSVPSTRIMGISVRKTKSLEEKDKSHAMNAQSEFVEAKIASEIVLELVSDVDYFITLPPPHVKYFGAAADGGGRSLANVVKLTANNDYYIVLVELHQVLLQSNDAVAWDVNDNNEFTYEGQISPAALFADKPISGNKKGRVQQCPTEPWAISFEFPSPVDSKTAWQVLVPSTRTMGISVRKTKSLEKKDNSRGNKLIWTLMHGLYTFMTLVYVIV